VAAWRDQADPQAEASSGLPTSLWAAALHLPGRRPGRSQPQGVAGEPSRRAGLWKENSLTGVDWAAGEAEALPEGVGGRRWGLPPPKLMPPRRRVAPQAGRRQGRQPTI